jgi:hypothetical protein
VQLGTATAATYSDTTAVAGTLYTYSVTASTAAGNSATSATDTGWRNVAVPGNVAATDGTYSNKVRVTWSAVTGATGYGVYRQLPGGAVTLIANVTPGTTVAYNDSTIPVSVVGTYSVRALTPSGNSAASATNTGFRASSFIGDPPPSGSGSGGGSPGVVSEADSAAGEGSANAPGRPSWIPNGPSGGTVGGTAQESGTPSDSVAGQDDLGERIPDCHGVIARIEARLYFLERISARTPAARAEAEALRQMIPTVDGDSSLDDGRAPACIACRMLAGDVNLDGTVDTEDIAVFLAAWAEGNILAADLNRDACIDHEDFAIILRAIAVQES